MSREAQWNPIREAQLKPAFADDYPTLVPGRWYTAAALANLVKATRIVREGPRAQLTGRILSPAHFAFRGGSPRQGSWLGLRSRRMDRYGAGAAPHGHSLAVA
jgi:hypothetical protein